MAPCSTQERNIISLLGLNPIAVERSRSAQTSIVRRRAIAAGHGSGMRLRLASKLPPKTVSAETEDNRDQGRPIKERKIVEELVPGAVVIVHTTTPQRSSGFYRNESDNQALASTDQHLDAFGPATPAATKLRKSPTELYGKKRSALPVNGKVGQKSIYDLEDETSSNMKLLGFALPTLGRREAVEYGSTLEQELAWKRKPQVSSASVSPPSTFSGSTSNEGISTNQAVSSNTELTKLEILQSGLRKIAQGALQDFQLHKVEFNAQKANFELPTISDDIVQHDRNDNQGFDILQLPEDYALLSPQTERPKSQQILRLTESKVPRQASTRISDDGGRDGSEAHAPKRRRLWHKSPAPESTRKTTVAAQKLGRKRVRSTKANELMTESEQMAIDKLYEDSAELSGDPISPTDNTSKATKVFSLKIQFDSRSKFGPIEVTQFRIPKSQAKLTTVNKPLYNDGFEGHEANPINVYMPVKKPSRRREAFVKFDICLPKLKIVTEKPCSSSDDDDEKVPRRPRKGRSDRSVPSTKVDTQTIVLKYSQQEPKVDLLQKDKGVGIFETEDIKASLLIDDQQQHRDQPTPASFTYVVRTRPGMSRCKVLRTPMSRNSLLDQKQDYFRSQRTTIYTDCEQEKEDMDAAFPPTLRVSDDHENLQRINQILSTMVVKDSTKAVQKLAPILDEPVLGQNNHQEEETESEGEGPKGFERSPIDQDDFDHDLGESDSGNSFTQHVEDFEVPWFDDQAEGDIVVTSQQKLRSPGECDNDALTPAPAASEETTSAVIEKDNEKNVQQKDQATQPIDMLVGADHLVFSTQATPPLDVKRCSTRTAHNNVSTKDSWMPRAPVGIDMKFRRDDDILKTDDSPTPLPAKFRVSNNRRAWRSQSILPSILLPKEVPHTPSPLSDHSEVVTSVLQEPLSLRNSQAEYIPSQQSLDYGTTQSSSYVPLSSDPTQSQISEIVPDDSITSSFIIPPKLTSAAAMRPWTSCLPTRRSLTDITRQASQNLGTLPGAPLPPSTTRKRMPSLLQMRPPFKTK